MDGAEFDDFVKDISEHGQMGPIVVDEPPSATRTADGDEILHLRPVPVGGAGGSNTGKERSRSLCLRSLQAVGGRVTLTPRRGNQLADDGRSMPVRRPEPKGDPPREPRARGDGQAITHAAAWENAALLLDPWVMRRPGVRGGVGSDRLGRGGTGR